MLVTTRIKHDHGGIERQKQGISSIIKLDSKLVFKKLNLKKGVYFLDIGCGAGDYAFFASSLVGDTGHVFALDMWEDLITKLNSKIDSQNIKNMRAMYANITQALPISDNSIDVCFIATVLHGINMEKYGSSLFAEIHRILKPNGRIAIIERKKDKASDKHPVPILLSPEEIGDYVKKYDFKQLDYTDLGLFYMAQYGINK